LSENLKEVKKPFWGKRVPGKGERECKAPRQHMKKSKEGGVAGGNSPGGVS
jgi:hypothetical protein